MSKRTAGIALTAILAVAAVLRLLYITDEGFWFDELWIWRQMQMGLGELMTDMVQNDVHPPLYELLLYPWTRILGSSELPLRLPSAIFGVAAVGVTYLLGRRTQNTGVALVAAGLLAVNEYAVYYGQEARSYSLLLLLSALTVYTWWGAVQRDGNRPLIAYALAGLAAAYTHVFGVLLLIYLTIAWFALRWRGHHGVFGFGRWLGVHLAMGMAYLPWIPAFLIQTSRVQDGFWIQRPVPWFWGPYFSKYVGHASLGLVGAMLLVWLCICLWRERRGPGQKPAQDSPSETSPASSSGTTHIGKPDERVLLGFYLGWFVFMLGVPYLISVISQPMMHAKSAISVIVPITLVLATAIQRFPVRVRVAVLVVWIAGSLWSIVATNYLAQNREAWREMTTAVEDGWQEGDLAVLYHHDYDYMYCYHYYLDSSVDAVELLCEGDDCLGPVASIDRRAQDEGIERIWLLKVRASDAFPEGLERNWVVTEEHAFNNGVLQVLRPAAKPRN